MSTNTVDINNVYTEIYKIKINKKLLKNLDRIRSICVLNIIEGENNEIINKYKEYCRTYINNFNTNEENKNNCLKCFGKFILEDLIYTEKQTTKYDPKDYKLNICGKDINK